MTVNRICICGAGTMGSGIAQAAAQAGFHTLLYDLHPGTLNKAKEGIDKNLGTLLEKGRITTREKEKTTALLQFTGDIRECLADVFIEAIIERLDAKITLFNQLTELNHSDCIFATNTSSLSVLSIANGVINPSRVIGMHFFNPATIMKLVEVITTPQTDRQTTATILDLAKQMHKVPVRCKDSPGFIVNRVARPFYVEALRQAEEGQVTMAQVDRLMEASGFKLGPFKLMDLIGNDINHAVSCSVFEQLGHPERLKPSFLQEEKVKAGHLGRKTGKGYYDYE